MLNGTSDGQAVLPRLAAVWHTRLPRGLALLAEGGAAALAAYSDFAPAAVGELGASGGSESGGEAVGGGAALCERRRSITDLFAGDLYAAAEAGEASDGKAQQELPMTLTGAIEVRS